MTQSKYQRGFAAIAAIFLIVALAALGSYMVSFSNSQQLTSAQDVQGSRAYWAARAGLEWGIGKVSAVASPSAIDSATCTTASPIVIDSFSVTVTCATPVAYLEAGNPKYIVQISSIASTTGGTVGSIGFIERSVSASLER
jgi:MSHA biogenesis protein MshP